MVKVALKLPEPLVITVAGKVKRKVEPSFIVTILLALKPKPETVTVLPTLAIVGDSVILVEVPTVNVADPILPPASVTVIT
jgi:hypothetical protein